MIQSLERAKYALKFSLCRGDLSRADVKKMVAISLGGDYYAVGAWYYTRQERVDTIGTFTVYDSDTLYRPNSHPLTHEEYVNTSEGDFFSATCALVKGDKVLIEGMAPIIAGYTRDGIDWTSRAPCMLDEALKFDGNKIEMRMQYTESGDKDKRVFQREHSPISLTIPHHILEDIRSQTIKDDIRQNTASSDPDRKGVREDVAERKRIYQALDENRTDRALFEQLTPEEKDFYFFRCLTPEQQDELLFGKIKGEKMALGYDYGVVSDGLNMSILNLRNKTVLASWSFGPTTTTDYINLACKKSGKIKVKDQKLIQKTRISYGALFKIKEHPFYDYRTKTYRHTEEKGTLECTMPPELFQSLQRYLQKKKEMSGKRIPKNIVDAMMEFRGATISGEANQNQGHLVEEKAGFCKRLMQIITSQPAQQSTLKLQPQPAPELQPQQVPGPQPKPQPKPQQSVSFWRRWFGHGGNGGM